MQQHDFDVDYAEIYEFSTVHIQSCLLKFIATALIPMDQKSQALLGFVYLYIFQIRKEDMTLDRTEWRLHIRIKG